jgi:hypothetical protein
LLALQISLSILPQKDTHNYRTQLANEALHEQGLFSAQRQHWCARGNDPLCFTQSPSNIIQPPDRLCQHHAIVHASTEHPKKHHCPEGTTA